VKSKRGFRVIMFVRIVRKCGHETDHSMKTTLGKIKKFTQTVCPDCKEGA